MRVRLVEVGVVGVRGIAILAAVGTIAWHYAHLVLCLTLGKRSDVAKVALIIRDVLLLLLLAWSSGS